MADFNVDGNIRFTIPANEESKLIFGEGDFIQHFSIRTQDFNNISFRYDGVDAVLDAAGTLPMSTSIVGYDNLYSRTRIGYISIICDVETDILLFNYY